MIRDFSRDDISATGMIMVLTHLPGRRKLLYEVNAHSIEMLYEVIAHSIEIFIAA